MSAVSRERTSLPENTGARNTVDMKKGVKIQKGDVTHVVAQ